MLALSTACKPKKTALFSAVLRHSGLA